MEAPKPPFINQFELQFSLTAHNGAIDINCALSDIRFVFAVPTAQNLALVGLSLQATFDDVELLKK